MYRSLVQLFLKENISIKRLMGFDVKKSKAKAILIGLAIVLGTVAICWFIGYSFMIYVESSDIVKINLD
jgi:hypothetical protein